LAGDGSLRNNLEKYILDNNINNIKFLGNVSDIPSFLLKVDILIVPSVSEGFGLAVLEGMVSGKVVIASDIKVMKELIKDGENGLLFESQNSESLVQIILKVLKDKELYEKLKNRAQLFVLKNKKVFDIREVSSSYQNLLL
jgi:glycosyltransferase involved in cell wall biosynthesis